MLAVPFVRLMQHGLRVYRSLTAKRQRLASLCAFYSEAAVS
jgi:hypothetical protein